MIYLDNAATSFPKPPEVYRSVYSTMTKICANPGRSGHKMSLAAGRVVYAAREMCCRYFHCGDPLSFVFCSNCTDALNLGIKGILKPRSHVVSTFLEHNSVLRVLKKLEAERYITLTLVYPQENGVVSAASIAKAIKSSTRLVVLTHCSNLTGAIQPVYEVGAMLKKRGIPFLIDAAQSAGILTLDLVKLEADLIAFPGHKGLYGPQGTGGLYIRPGLLLKTLKEGGTGTASDSFFQPMETPERYESGTLNTPGLAGLYAGLRFVMAHQSEILPHERELSTRLITGLKNMKNVIVYSPEDPNFRSGVVAFNLQHRDSGEVADALNDHGIAVRAGLHCAPLAHKYLGTLQQGAIRASFGFFNTAEDVDALLSALCAVQKEP